MKKNNYFILTKDTPSGKFKRVITNSTYGDYLVFDSADEALSFIENMVSIASSYVNRITHAFNKISTINNITAELENMPYADLIFNIISNIYFNIYSGMCSTIEESKQYIDTCCIVSEYYLNDYL